MSPDTKIPNTSQLPRPSQPRVLIVDDEPSVRMITRLQLEGANYAVTVAGTATEALACVRGADPAFKVILLDVGLPDQRGTDLLPELRTTSPQSSVVLISGDPKENVPDHGANGFLAKPFTRDQLLAAIRAATAVTPR